MIHKPMDAINQDMVRAVMAQVKPFGERFSGVPGVYICYPCYQVKVGSRDSKGHRCDARRRKEWCGCHLHRGHTATRGCGHYIPSQGCPLHGETCR